MPTHSAATFALLVLLPLASGATTAAAASNGDSASNNVTTPVVSVIRGNSSSATVLADGNHGPETYSCYFCSGRNLLMLHLCPIYWDECHLVCDPAVRDAAAVATGPASTAASVLPGETLDDDDNGGGDPGDDDECYVMKLYNDGRYVLVSVVKCGQAKSCFLTCGGGEEVHGTGGNASQSAAPPAPFQFQQQRLADFQRCGDTVVRSRDRSSSYKKD